ncbi:MAG: hypothetical protein ABI377_07410 [Devosia sp.]
MSAQICQVELELGREPQHPFGERGRLYHLYLPLKADGSLDADALRGNRGCCRGRRLRVGHEPAEGRISLGAQGELVLEYDDAPLHQSIVRLNAAPLAVGESVPIAEADGELHEFQVISVRHA